MTSVNMAGFRHRNAVTSAKRETADEELDRFGGHNAVLVLSAN